MKDMKFGDVLTKDPLVWRGHRFFIYLLCVPEMIFLGLLGLTYLSPSNLALQSAVFVVGMLTVGLGIFAKALAWILLAALWSSKPAPRETKIECTAVLGFATMVFLVMALTALRFKT